MAFTKPNVNRVWAATGTSIAPTNSKIDQGWVVEIPDFEFENFIQNRQDQFNAHVNQYGIPVWDAATEYQADKSYVQGSDGFIYKALTTNTNQNPVTQPTHWSRAFNDFDYSYSKATADSRFLNSSDNLSDLGSTATARTNLNVYSKTESDARYLDEANNLSDLDDAPTARTNLGVYGTTEVYNKTESDDRFVNTSGDAMTGALTLSGDPTLALHAAPRQYVDSEGNKRVIYLTDVSELEGLTPTIEGQTYSVTGYHPLTDIGGGDFYWDSTLDKSNHDGGTVIDPGKTFPIDWSVGVDVTAWFTGDGVGTGCFVRSGIKDIMPQMFGAGAAIVDSSASVQQAINYARVSYSNAVGKFEYSVDFGGKSFACAKSIDAVLVRQPGLTIKNGGIYSTAIGRIALDLAGTNEPILDNFKVYGDPDSPPAVGIYHGRALINGGFPASASAKFSKVDVNGYFGKASVLNMASEVSNYSQCFYINRSRSLTAYSYINVNDAQTIVDFVGALTSDYATLPVPADGSFSNILHNEQQPHYLRNADVILTVTDISNTNPAVVTVDSTALTNSELVNGNEVYFYNVVGMTEINFRTFTVQNINTVAGTFELAGEDATGHGTFTSGQVFNRTGPAVLLGGAQATTWESGYLLTYGNDPVRIDLDGGTDTRGMNLAFHAEHSPKRIFALYSNTVNRLVPDMKITLLQSNQVITDEIFRVNGAGGVIFNGIDLDIAHMAQAPVNGIFANANQFQLKNAKIYSPFAAALSIGSLGSFTGSFYAADTDTETVRGQGNSFRFFNDAANATRFFRIDDRATTAQLESITDRVNVEDKYAGKMVWNVTTTKPVFATNSVDGGTWRDATGTIVHTPV